MPLAGVPSTTARRPEDRELAISDADQGRRDEPGAIAASRSFASDRLAEHWSFGEPVRPAEAVTATINRFSPRDVPTEVWKRVEPVVKHTVTTVSFADPALARRACSVVGQLAFWADRIGLPVDAEALFTPELIDRFITEGCTHLTDGTRLNYRSQLWQIGEAVVGHTLFPPRSVPLPASPSWPPYSPVEVTDLVSWSRGLPTQSMRRESWALLSLGLGAGLRPEEIVRAVGTDIHEEDGLVLVDVLGTGGRIDRVVPAHRDWAAAVLELARESGDRPYFQPRHDRIHRNTILSFIRRCSVDEVPKFKVQRLRTTWIVGHLSAGTHLVALEQASGVRASQLVRYLQFATPPSQAGARQMLSGSP